MSKPECSLTNSRYVCPEYIEEGGSHKKIISDFNDDYFNGLESKYRRMALRVDAMGAFALEDQLNHN